MKIAGCETVSKNTNNCLLALSLDASVYFSLQFPLRSLGHQSDHYLEHEDYLYEHKICSGEPEHSAQPGHAPSSLHEKWRFLIRSHPQVPLLLALRISLPANTL